MSEVTTAPETATASTSATTGTTGTQPGPALADRGSTRSQRPTSEAFKAFIASSWAPRPAPPARSTAAPWARARRQRLSALFPGDRLVLPAGPPRVRSNDTDYRYRPHSAFAHLTGLGTDRESDAVLVLEPVGDAHEARLYLRPRAERDSEEFYANARYGEFWVGPRPSLEELSVELDIDCRHLDDLDDDLHADLPAPLPGGAAPRVRIIPGADPALEASLDDRPGDREPVRVPVPDRSEDSTANSESSAKASDEASDGDEDDEGQDADAQLAEAVSEMRLVKDAYEIDQMRAAVTATVAGFADVVRALPAATAHARGERVVETAFDAHARREGNGVGYDTIAAAGAHACTLHWVRNDGPVRAGDLVLVDAGVEADSLYTADITRTLPVSGRFSDVQRRVYTAVLDAADAAFAVARPGAVFRDVHAAAMEVIAARLHDWGLLPVSVEEALDRDTGGQHRRWMVHGTSHHLGIDVHDCAQARRQMYLDAELVPGMIFTIEPGLYFKEDDLLVPPELRGIGVRIEDDVLVTESGCENLSAALPRRTEDIEAWMASVG